MTFKLAKVSCQSTLRISTYVFLLNKLQILKKYTLQKLFLKICFFKIKKKKIKFIVLLHLNAYNLSKSYDALN